MPNKNITMTDVVVKELFELPSNQNLPLNFQLKDGESSTDYQYRVLRAFYDIKDGDINFLTKHDLIQEYESEADFVNYHLKHKALDIAAKKIAKRQKGFLPSH